MNGSVIRSALVLGGTGHIGSAIARELLGQGASVTVASRQDQTPRNLLDLDLRFLRLRTASDTEIARAVQGHDLVVDAAAPYPLCIRDSRRAAGIDPVSAARGRTEAILAAVRRHRSRLAVVGSFTTLPRPKDIGDTIESRLLERIHPYFAVKRTIEQSVLAAARRGTPALIVNPSGVFGPWDCKPPDLCWLPMVLNGTLPFTSFRIINVVDVRDVAKGLVAAVQAGAYGQRLPLTGHNVRISDLTTAAANLAGTRPPRLVGSTRLGACLALWGDLGWGLLGIDTPVPSLPILLTRYSYPMDRSEAERQLVLEPHPLSDTLVDAIRWYAQAGYLRHLRPDVKHNSAATF